MADDPSLTPFFSPAAAPYSSSPALAVTDAYLATLAGDRTLDIATVVAAVATDPKDATTLGIRLIRAIGAGRFTRQLKDEWEKFTAQGKIKGDYSQTGQARTLLGDTLESLSNANFDEEQLDLLRRLFLAAASEAVTDRNDVLAREYLAVGRTLATGEIRVLAAYHRYLPEWWKGAKDVHPLHNYSAHVSIDVVRKHSGLTHTALIERHERSLIEKGLVRAYRSPGMPEVDAKHYRLTDFGLAFCEFLKSYDRMKGASGSK